MARIVPLLALTAALAGPVAAQDIEAPPALPPSVLPAADPETTRADRDFLTGLIEDNLSGTGRTLRLEGFRGALSSEARFDSLTIADDAGVWLTISDGVIAWNRGALLSGRIEVDTLKAARIELPRLPTPAPDQAPAAEATPFALPELPVGVQIGRIEAERIVLGAPVLGQAAELSASGALTLADGGASAQLSAKRLDEGPEGRFSLNARYDGTTSEAAIDLLAQEGAGGIAAGLLGLPEAPALQLALAGNGPLRGFSADMRLSVDNRPQLSGHVETRADKDGAQILDLALSGDPGPFLPADQAAFLGPDVRVTAQLMRAANGRLRLPAFEIAAGGVQATGTGALLASGRPDHLSLAVRLGAEDMAVPLPGGGTAEGGQLDLGFDRSRGEAWRLQGQLRDVVLPAGRMAALDLRGSGRVQERRDRPLVLGGTVEMTASGLAPRDARLARALGPQAQARTIFTWSAAEALRLSRLELAAAGARAGGNLRLDITGAKADLEGALDLDLPDLARYSALAGRALSGAAEARLEGRAELLSGAFDGELSAQATGLSAGFGAADGLWGGTSDLVVSARRDADGLELRRARFTAGQIRAEAGGRLSSEAADLNAQIAAPSLAPLARGSLTAQAALTGPAGGRALALSGTSRALGLGLGTLDQILGQSIALSADVTQIAGAQGGWRVAADLRGPGATDARIEGQVAADLARADLNLAGRTGADLAAPFLGDRALSGPLDFDLRLNGAPGLSALSGRVTGAGLRLADPALGLVLEDMQARADLAGGAAQVSAGARLREGGRMDLRGRIGLSGGFDAALRATLAQAHLRDPELFDTSVSGDLSIDGPLTGGARIAGNLELGQTELRIPAGLATAAPIPDLIHRAEPAAVRATRARAGLLAQAEAAAPGRAYPLDIGLSAPRRIFVRGRGVDAELGGALRLGGTSAAVAPAGEFRLIRGRLDILAKRFDLTEGLIRLQGALVPWLRFAATTTEDEVSVTIGLEGPADAPELSFTSSPELPEDEILARILFGRAAATLSPFQAAQMASAVASLAGKGGEGMVGRLRANLGLDDFDVTSGADGETELRFGKYLGENLYTDVTVDSQGQSEVTINLDVSPNLTVRGAMGQDGGTGVGIYYERDY
ncbi:translocation/assembly module TamB domain-containing protein [Phaeovulum vinaykumarii]|uniref:Translocation and assembly module TamB n=1 Tax=Phaeovulum vinaykumarii TaxID=407234 RepID=A0A1N7K8V9_9RHOB|nr:translocation/assembly module TamB domain-containing protein [Phaeovulum vinaykumarii]SIS57982.1 translocation and assembly module TamB [Phaeovulum vinaykumarii]SOB93640.1 translocation and assembly module TamB [Phaeovulum vinaykumarii]